MFCWHDVTSLPPKKGMCRLRPSTVVVRFSTLIHVAPRPGRHRFDALEVDEHVDGANDQRQGSYHDEHENLLLIVFELISFFLCFINNSSWIYLFIYSFTHLLIQSFIRSLGNSLIHSSIRKNQNTKSSHLCHGL